MRSGRWSEGLSETGRGGGELLWGKACCLQFGQVCFVYAELFWLNSVLMGDDRIMDEFNVGFVATLHMV